MAALKIGDAAPDFEVPAVTGEKRHKFKLSDYRGKKHVVLAFYPLDWSPTCSAQVPAYNTELEKFAGYDAQVVGMSVDSIPSHIAWQQKSIGTLNYPLASDFWPHGAVAERYGILRTGEPIPGMNERAVFIVDKEGKLVFRRVYEIDEQPKNEECFEVLRKLQLAA